MGRAPCRGMPRQGARSARASQISRRQVTAPPIARLKPTGDGNEVRLGYWSHRRIWEDIDDMGGVVMPLDEALEFIANEPVFWTWT